MTCKYCEKECKNKRSLVQHELRCVKNPNKIEVSFNLKEYNSNPRPHNNYDLIDIQKCQYCNKECKNTNSLKQHEIRCKSNPNAIKITSNFIKYNEKVKNREITKKFSNQHSKAKELGYRIEVSKETREKIGNKSRGVKWSEERKKEHSLIMSKIASENPDSYSSNNVSGRVKMYSVINTQGEIVNVKGSWELLVAEYLNINNIKWTNIINEEIYYEWNNQTRRYYPDFYLIEYDIYIEVKGYERDRDLAKWQTLKNRLLILKKDEINLIRNNNFIFSVPRGT